MSALLILGKNISTVLLSTRYNWKRNDEIREVNEIPLKLSNTLANYAHPFALLCKTSRKIRRERLIGLEPVISEKDLWSLANATAMNYTGTQNEKLVNQTMIARTKWSELFQAGGGDPNNIPGPNWKINFQM